jgi:PIN domain nuclease of toxin-antitoxin system
VGRGLKAPLLLDTYALLDLERQRLESAEALAWVEDARPARRAFVPSIVALELAQKVWAGKLDLGPAGPAAWFRDALTRFGLRPLLLRSAVAFAAYALPEPFHRDPADRLIVAAARAVGGRVLTCDERILAYAEAGHVAAVAY